MEVHPPVQRRVCRETRAAHTVGHVPTETDDVQDRLRVAVLAGTWNPIRSPFLGGQEMVTAQLARGLRSRGHHVTLHALAGSDPDLADELVPYAEPPAGWSDVAATDVNLPEPRFLTDQAAMVSALERLGRSRPDVVLNQSLHYLVPALSGLLGVPVVTTLHTPPYPWLELGAAAATGDCTYVAVSQHVAAQWSTLPAVEVIPNGVDPAAFPLGPGGDAWCWVGRIVPHKGLHVAIAAAREAGRALRIVGPIEDADYYADRIAPHLHSGVEHLGHRDHGALAEVLGSSALTLVTPRWDEPFGMVAVESAMTGTPVVAIARGGLPEAVGDTTGVLVADSADEETLAPRMVAAAERAEALPREVVRRRAMQRSSAAAQVAAYERLLHRVVGEAARR